MVIGKKRKFREERKSKGTHTPISTGNSQSKNHAKSGANSNHTNLIQPSNPNLIFSQQKDKKLSKLEQKKLLRSQNTELPTLTPTERKVFLAHFQEFLTPRQICRKLQIKINTFKTHKNNIKKKGLWDRWQLHSHKSNLNGYPSPLLRLGNNTKKAMCHGHELVIKIIDKSEKFLRKISKEKTLLINIDNNRVIVNDNIVQIYGKKDFSSESHAECEKKSIDYFTNLIKKLESRQGLILLKEGYDNIRYSHRGHYLDADNYIAQDFTKKNQVLICYGKDGKQYLKIDHSDGEDHFECVHPQSSKDDMTKFDTTFDNIKAYCPGGMRTYFDDLKHNFSDNNPFVPSQIVNDLTYLSKHMAEITSHLDKFLTQNEKLSKYVSKLAKNTNKFNSEMNTTIYELGASNKNLITSVESITQILQLQLKSHPITSPSVDLSDQSTSNTSSSIPNPLDRDINPYM